MLNNVNESNKEVENFLKIICNQRSLSLDYSKEKIKTLNENKDKIKGIVNYVLTSDESKIKALMPNQLPGLNWLLQYKTYIILCLIQFGINPFEIKKCIESSSSAGLTWNEFLKAIEQYNGRWSFVFQTSQRGDAVEIFDSIFIVELINILEALLNQNNNSDQGDIKATIDIFSNYFSHSWDASLWRFIWFYLNENIQITEKTQAMKEFLLGIPNGFIFKNYLDDESKNELKKANKKELSPFDIMSKCSDTSGKYFEAVDIQSDFKDLFKMLDPVLIGIFALILMRRISFTNEQMNSIASKINNDQVMTTLRQINQSLDYKKSNVDTWRCNGKDNNRHVKFSSITHGLDYLFLKISRGVGYLGALLWWFLHFIPPVIIASVPGFIFTCLLALTEFTSYGYGIFFFWSTPFWICFGVGVGIFTIIFSMLCADFYRSELSSWWRDFPDNMQDFYNGSKVVRWLELYNIKHPTNSVELPSQQIDINFPNGPTSSYTNSLKLRESDINGNDTTKILPKSVFNENEISEPTETNP